MYRVVQIEYFSLKVSLNSIPTLYFALFTIFTNFQQILLLFFSKFCAISLFNHHNTFFRSSFISSFEMSFFSLTNYCFVLLYKVVMGKLPVKEIFFLPEKFTGKLPAVGKLQIICFRQFKF